MKINTFYIDSDCFFIGTKSSLAIELTGGTLMQLPDTAIELLQADTVMTLCRQASTPYSPQINRGDYLRFMSDGFCFEGFVVYADHERGQYDVTGDDGNNVLPYMKGAKGFQLLGYLSVNQVIDLLVENT